MFGFADTEKVGHLHHVFFIRSGLILLCLSALLYDGDQHIHIHMVVLDSLTDLPLVIIIMVTDAYQVHWWIFIGMLHFHIPLLFYLSVLSLVGAYIVH